MNWFGVIISTWKTKTFGSDMKNWETLTWAPMTKLLLEERVLTYRSIVTLNGQHVEIPTLFELHRQPLLPLQVVKFSDIAAETGVKWGRVHPMSVGDTRFLSVLTLTEAYKSDWAKIQQILHRLIAWCKLHPSQQDTTPMFDESKDGTFRTWLSGGSATGSGHVAPKMTKAKKTDPTFNIPSGQKRDADINRAILAAEHCDGVVCIMVDYNVFAKKLFQQEWPEKAKEVGQCNKKEMGVVLGYFQLYASESVRATEAEYNAFVESQKGIVKDFKNYSLIAAGPLV
jgi:hypothetical protein